MFLWVDLIFEVSELAMSWIQVKKRRTPWDMELVEAENFAKVVALHISTLHS
jgi:hypothetical protein